MLAYRIQDLDGSLMEKTLDIILKEFKEAIINQIQEYEIHVDEPRDASFNLGLDQAIEAVKETEYVTR